jgi:hypothetical protein
MSVAEELKSLKAMAESTGEAYEGYVRSMLWQWLQSSGLAEFDSEYDDLCSEYARVIQERMIACVSQNYNYLTQPQRRDLRMLYVRLQGGVCWYCGWPLDQGPSLNIAEAKIDWTLFPENFTKYPVHLHHDHFTGMTIGAVHSICNAYLWQYHGE